VSILLEERLNIFLLQGKIWMLTKTIGNPVYDFPFEQFFNCDHKWQLPNDMTKGERPPLDETGGSS